MRLRMLVIFMTAFLQAACGAVYPELSTPTRVPPAHHPLEPKPSDDLLFIAFEGATIPTRTRDGRTWDAVGGAAPDPFVKLYVNGKPLIVTPTQSNTLRPTWPEQQRANYRIAKHSNIRVELWDSNTLNNTPICVTKIGDIHLAADDGRADLRCDSGARISMIVQPARGVLGLGLYYELRTEDMVVTRVIRESAASRAGLYKGAQILAIEDRDVSQLDAGEAKSLINAKAPLGVKLKVRFSDGSEEQVTLKEEAMYPEPDEGIDLP